MCVCVCVYVVSILRFVCYIVGSTQGISCSLLASLWYSVVPFNPRSPLIFQAQFFAWLTFDQFRLCHCFASSIWKRPTPRVVDHFSILKTFILRCNSIRLAIIATFLVKFSICSASFSILRFFWILLAIFLEFSCIFFWGGDSLRFL